MGMAASQARFLSLTARKDNVEYEGQQINQQRTTLSNQSSNYYSRLCELDVPTPPSSEDYTKTVYSFTNGDQENTINTIIATVNGKYIVNYTQDYNTESMLSNGSVMATRTGTEDNYTYSIGATKLRVLGTEDDSDSYLSKLTEDERNDAITLENSYKQMLNDKYPSNDGTWYVRYQKDSDDGVYYPVFFNKEDLDNATYSSNDTSLTSIKSYKYGQTTETKEYKNVPAKLTQDSSGRFISIYLYEKDTDGDGVLDSGTEYTLDVATSNDTAAYNDAVNKYNYKKSEYDQEIQSINAKIEIIQQEDKSLELRLKQLDTEESAISTEMESIKKVISKNVEKTFNVFDA